MDQATEKMLREAAEFIGAQALLALANIAKHSGHGVVTIEAKVNNKQVTVYVPNLSGEKFSA